MKLLFFISLLLSTALQGVAIFLLFHEGSLPLLLLTHLSSSVIWGWGATFLLPTTGRRLWWLPTSCALIFPVWGALASLLIIRVLRQPPPKQIGKNYVIWEAQNEARWKEPTAQAVSAQAVVEILQSPHPASRRQAILSLRNLDPRLSIPLLRKGLLDSDEQVRIYAQNILADILGYFEDRIKNLEQTQHENPQSAPAAIRLAESYFELVYLDVSGDSDSDAHNLGQALALLELAHALDPGSQRIGFLALKYALRADDLTKAKKWLRILEQQNFDPNQLMPWRLEIAYLERDWDKLRTLFTTYDHEADINPRIGQLGRFWFGQRTSRA